MQPRRKRGWPQFIKKRQPVCLECNAPSICKLCKALINSSPALNRLTLNAYQAAVRGNWLTRNQKRRRAQIKRTIRNLKRKIQINDRRPTIRTDKVRSCATIPAAQINIQCPQRSHGTDTNQSYNTNTNTNTNTMIHHHILHQTASPHSVWVDGQPSKNVAFSPIWPIAGSYRSPRQAH